MTIKAASRMNPDLGQLIYTNRPHTGRTSIDIRPVRKPSWRREVEKATRVSDLSMLVGLVHAAEKALFLRCQELADCPNTIDEREAIRAATNELLSVKVHKLKWPDFTLLAEPQARNQNEIVPERAAA
ncbi:MAG: hypothetical protein WA209_18035 [Candidatus Acidiferrales bacterium]